MKKRFKAIVGFGIAFTMAAFLTGCSKDETVAVNGESSQKTQVLKVAFNQPDTHPQYKAMEQFGEELKEKTNGAYEIEMYPNELLGAQRETIELVQSGTISMSIVAGSLMENFNDEFVVFNLPYVFDSKDHQLSVFNNSDIIGDLYSSVEDQGMSVVGAFHGGIRNVYNNVKPIETPADLKGLKVRIIDSDTNIKMMENMGGVGTPMGQGEVYTALQSGVLEGGENNELIYANLKHSEIAPYYSYTQHLMIPDYLIINNDLLKGMSEEHRKIFEEGFASAVDNAVELWDKEVENAISDAEADGAKFNNPDIKVFQDAVQPLIEEKLSSEGSKALYDKVREAAK
ncbi:TRAP transporter substrate-binding protein [Psychrobacillus psychrodurans]|uniref:TRAP transporter substrate-binding protein n=1 Tax=Psychrobacillus psychrodurans TaxID=126157 RepID=A0A9X3L9G5_9BACI|nr:TRAP transporter substrate-binding protein [Psychrobacillus psychrodurans]MCZ8531984.1 TRAP transporter substrate-binding protein [Psychrobacillus psychrodurans]